MQTGLHRNTISKVYRQLEVAGVVEAQPGSGIYVRTQGSVEIDKPRSPLLAQFPKAQELVESSLDVLLRQGCSLHQARELFLGEIAFLTNAASSASLWLEEGAEVLEWQFDELRRRCERVPRFKLALEASISVDLARKVSWSMGRDAVRVEHIPKPMVDALSVAD